VARVAGLVTGLTPAVLSRLMAHPQMSHQQMPCPVCAWYGGDHAPTCPNYVGSGRRAGGIVALIVCVFLVLMLLGVLISNWSS
jgi:hypothetical protein